MKIKILKKKKMVILILTVILIVFVGILVINYLVKNKPSNPKEKIKSLKDVKYWTYQINGDYSEEEIEKIVKSKYDMVVLEPTRTSKETADYGTVGMVKKIKASKAHDGVSDKIVLAYVDIGEAEDWRCYWDDIKKTDDIIIGTDPDKWEGDYPVAYWKDKWRSIVVNGLINEAVTDGFDGVYLDWVGGFTEPMVIEKASADGVDPKKEMTRFISEICSFAKSKNSNFLIVQQNAPELAINNSEVFKYVDAIAQEAVWYDGTAFEDWDSPDACDKKNERSMTEEYLKNLKIYQNEGKVVFNVEYADKHADEAYKLSRENGFIPYCTRRALSELTRNTPY
jgi:cysteinyl-tRNA synthetase, unknown class